VTDEAQTAIYLSTNSFDQQICAAPQPCATIKHHTYETKRQN